MRSRPIRTRAAPWSKSWGSSPASVCGSWSERYWRRGENLGLEDDLREHELNKLYNSTVGRRALGRPEAMYAIDVEVAGSQSGNYIFAPAPLIAGLRVGDTVHGELLTCWTIPQSEVDLLGTDTKPDYNELKIWHVRDADFDEI